MKVVITGANGFIGSHICQYFFDKDHEVIAWHVQKRQCKWICRVVDLMSAEFVTKQLMEDRPDTIIHCAGAADVGKSVREPYMDYCSNVTITHNLLFGIHEAGLLATRVIFLSSASVYGNPVNLPITEDMDINPLSPYALHKVMCEDICRYFYQNNHMDIKIVRIFSAYGNGLKKQIFWDMYQKYLKTGALSMFGTGLESRDYIHVKDVVQAIYLIALNAPKTELLYNIANGEEMTIRQATEHFADAIGIEKNLISFDGVAREGNPINWKADISKLKRLGYKKTVEFAKGILEYINWVKEE